MKTSVTKIMMSFALMGCLIFSASDAMAQGRSRSQGGSTSSRSQSAAVSRSNNTTAPTVSRNTNSSSSSRSSATPQVNRSSSSSSRSVTTAPQVNRSSSNDNKSTTVRPSASGSNNKSSGSRVGTGATTRGNSSSTSGSSNLNLSKDRRDKSMMDASGLSKGERKKDTNGGIDNKSTRPSGKPDNGGKPGNGGKPDNGGKPGNGGKHGNGGKPGNGNIDNGHGGKPGNGRHNDRDRDGGKRGFNPKNRYDYTNHHYRDQFSWNYKNHNWSRPLPPPARAHRPAPWAWHRPVVPAGWSPFSGAPIIDRILDIVFGTYYFDSLNHLYCNGYYIDGYADDVIYLRDVPMLGLYWSDVMLNYSSNRFANAQFVYYSDRYDDTRYNIVINKLTRIYGVPVCRDGVTVSWFGSDGIGFVTLSMMKDYTGYYTTMSIGY